MLCDFVRLRDELVASFESHGCTSMNEILKGHYRRFLSIAVRGACAAQTRSHSEGGTSSRNDNRLSPRASCQRTLGDVPSPRIRKKGQKRENEGKTMTFWENDDAFTAKSARVRCVAAKRRFL